MLDSDDALARGCAAGEHTAAGRRTHRAAAVKAPKVHGGRGSSHLDKVGGHCWRFMFTISIVDVPVAHIVQQQEDDVGPQRLSV